jgi:stage V sporulation protein G
MKITDIRIFPVDEPKLKAFVSIIFDHCFIISDIKIIEGNNGLFLSMPSKKRRDGTFKDIAHPLNSETRKMLEDAVISAYKEQERHPKTEEAPLAAGLAASAEEASPELPAAGQGGAAEPPPSSSDRLLGGTF